MGDQAVTCYKTKGLIYFFTGGNPTPSWTLIWPVSTAAVHAVKVLKVQPAQKVPEHHHQVQGGHLLAVQELSVK